jgi:putative peptidoglycan lipid II flippase
MVRGVTGDRARTRFLRGLIGEAGFVGVAAIVASAAVLLRDIAISKSLGRTHQTDVLLAGLMVATTIAQLVPGTFQTSVFSAAVAAKLHRGADAMYGLLGAVSLRFAVLTVVLVAPLVVLADPIARMIASAGGAADLAEVLVILSGFAAALALTELAKSILGLERHYVVYAVVGGFGNLLLVGLIVVRDPVTARGAALLVCGAFAAAVVVAWAVCLAMGLVRFDVPLAADDRRRIYAQAPPSLGAGLITVGMSVIDQVFTMSLGQGSYATLSFAQRWPLFATQLPALALGTVLLRTMAEDAVRLAPAALRARVRHVALLGAGLGLAACLGGLLVGPFVIRATLEGGQFTAADADAVISVQNLLFLQAPFYMAGIVYLRVLNAFQRNGINFVIGLASLALNAILDWAFTRHWHLGVHGIALSTVLVYLWSGTSLVVAGEYVLRHRDARAPSA